MGRLRPDAPQKAPHAHDGADKNCCLITHVDDLLTSVGRMMLIRTLLSGAGTLSVWKGKDC